MNFSELVQNMDPDAHRKNLEPLDASKIPESKQQQIEDYFRNQTSNVTSKI